MTTVTDIRKATQKALSKPSVDSTRDDFDPSRCADAGCPCKGSVAMGGSNRFQCSWHAFAAPERADDITTKLTEHRWLIDHITHLQLLHRQGAKNAPWVAAAQTFWAEQPEMLPTPVERANWNFYLWRLREELSFRIGLRKDRPAPREPQKRLPQFAPREFPAPNAETDDVA